YSRREGTPAAARKDQIRHSVKVERAARMSQVSRDSAQAYAQRYVGRQLDFLAEDELVVNGIPYVRGHSSNYLSLLLPIADAPSALCPVRALTWTEHGLLVEKL